jgi:hypothetical protein
MQFHNFTMLLQCFFILQRQDELHSNTAVVHRLHVQLLQQIHCATAPLSLLQVQLEGLPWQMQQGLLQWLVLLMESPLLRKVLLAARSS